MAKKLGGVAGIWLDDHAVVAAAHKVREAGYKKFDAITPFPVHGIEEAVGISRSPIPYVTFLAGLTGLSAGLALTYWTSAVSWPLNIGGKPFFSGPAFVPIMFELTILFAALFSIGAMIILCRLPKIDPPVIDPDLTSHKFAIFIPENDVNYDAARAEQLLRSLGATEVKRVLEY
ncbi:MAG TPA: DUF3341 domain-containing protein [Bdellovibrionales bacterium]|jgi:hypothetical protein|nr:DUF3341 domain-containing protein [Bdellovibrionales bacterium]